MSLTGGKGGAKLKTSQIKLYPIFNKKAPFLFKKGAKMTKNHQKTVKTTLLLFLYIHLFLC